MAYRIEYSPICNFISIEGCCLGFLEFSFLRTVQIVTGKAQSVPTIPVFMGVELTTEPIKRHNRLLYGIKDGAQPPYVRSEEVWVSQKQALQISMNI